MSKFTACAADNGCRVRRAGAGAGDPRAVQLAACPESPRGAGNCEHFDFSSLGPAASRGERLIAADMRRLDGLPNRRSRPNAAQSVPFDGRRTVLRPRSRVQACQRGRCPGRATSRGDQRAADRTGRARTSAGAACGGPRAAGRIAAKVGSIGALRSSRRAALSRPPAGAPAIRCLAAVRTRCAPRVETISFGANAAGN
jgi:hypothetical protein